jgi:hypothetical protein
MRPPLHFTDSELRSVASQYLRGDGYPTVEQRRAMACRLIELIEERANRPERRPVGLRLIEGGK